MNCTARRAAMVILGGGVVATLAGQAGASYSSTVLSDNPLAYYRLDDTGTAVADSSGNGHNGAVTQGNASDPTRQTSSLVATDPSGYSTTFKTGGSNASVPAFDHSGTGFSVEFFVNFPTLPTATYTNLVGDRTGGVNFELMVYTHNDGTNVYFRPHVNTTNGYLNPDITAAPIVAGKTYDVVSTYDVTSNTQDFYLNGALIYSAAGNSGTLINTGNPLYFGQDPQGDGTTPGALLDEVAIYNHALTGAQVTEHYNASVPEPASVALVALAGIGTSLLRTRRRQAR